MYEYPSKRDVSKRGLALVMVVFITALLAATVVGHLQIATEEIQVMQNQIGAAQALATAEAGLNDALAQLRADVAWESGYVDKPFNGGSYSVTVAGGTITATGTSERGFAARVTAEITVAPDGPPYLIRIDSLRINE
jgi:type II secretory pathway component PulK